ISASGLTLSASGPNANITINRNITITGPNRNGAPAVTILSDSGGQFQIASGSTLNSFGGNVSILSGGPGTFNSTGKINAGGNNVQIGPSANTTIEVFPTVTVGTSFNVVASSLNNITAGGFTFGSQTFSGGINLDNPINVTTGRIFNVGLQNAGNYQSNGNTI